MHSQLRAQPFGTLWPDAFHKFNGNVCKFGRHGRDLWYLMDVEGRLVATELQPLKSKRANLRSALLNAFRVNSVSVGQHAHRVLQKRLEILQERST